MKKANMIPLGGGRSAPPASCPNEKLDAFLQWFDGDKPTDEQRESFSELAQTARQVLRDRQALAKVDTSGPLQKVHDPEIINARLEELKNKYHLVTPAQQVDILPEGFGVSVTYVTVDPKRDVYPTGDGKMALHQTALHEIARGANLTWDDAASRCLDDRSEPFYCHFRAVGTVLGLDNAPMRVMGTTELDLRDGSAACEQMHTAAKKKGKPNANARIEGMRAKIIAHAETRARNRAIACMGVRRSYTRDELAKPFAIARLTFTGWSEDPELRKEFAKMAVAAALGSKNLLYPAPAPTVALPPAASAPELGSGGHRPPPVAARSEDPELDDTEPPWGDDGAALDTEGEEANGEPDPEDDGR